MAQVTVGVPVYNGAKFLEKSLTCLREQTFRDIEVLIFDNCSEDATGEIALRFCATDPRFRYFRQPENKGAAKNFIDVLEAAKTPFFLWRAADDTSDLNYIETLLALLIAHPECNIAVSRIVSVLPDGKVMNVHPVTPLMGRGEAIDRLAQLFGSHCSWIYGLFRRETMIPIYREVTANYPQVLGADNLMMFVFQFDRKVIGTNATTFYQYLRYPEPRLSSAMRARRDDAKIERGRLFSAFAHKHVGRTISNPVRRWIYHATVAYFVHKRSCSVTKRLRRGLARSLRLATAPNTGSM